MTENFFVLQKCNFLFFIELQEFLLPLNICYRYETINKTKKIQNTIKITEQIKPISIYFMLIVQMQNTIQYNKSCLSFCKRKIITKKIHNNRIKTYYIIKHTRNRNNSYFLLNNKRQNDRLKLFKTF